MSLDSAELGMHLEDVAEGRASEEVPGTAAYEEFENDKDYFVVKDGVKFAGTHLLFDLWGAECLDDPKAIEEALCEAAVTAKATILHSHFHHFSPNGGVSGVVVLAESHISIHTWPERDFAAIDVFMCGDCNPYDTLGVIKETFKPDNIQLAENRRGLLP